MLLLSNDVVMPGRPAAGAGRIAAGGRRPARGDNMQFLARRLAEVHSQKRLLRNTILEKEPRVLTPELLL